MGVIGISCFYHDSAAALVSNKGEILAAAQEERFTRRKHDSRFPYCSIDYCLRVAKEKNENIEAYIYYEKPIRIFMRLLETYFETSPRGFSSFLPAMKSWITKKLFTRDEILDQISLLDENFNQENLFFEEHHSSHASSAFYPSPFHESAVLCLDAVGEWATTSAWEAKGNEIKPLWDINFPDSIGLLYSSFTYYCGFKVNSGEYKLMGLAPYGKPKFAKIISENMIDIKKDGSFKLNMKYFKYQRGLKMISSEFINLFGASARKPNEEITQFYMDIAASIQKITEDIILKIAKELKSTTKSKNLCLAGGVALNCVANGKILEKAGFENIWIQPASGDSGNALGCALSYIYKFKKENRVVNKMDSMHSAYLGPDFSDDLIKDFLSDLNIKFVKLKINELSKITSKKLSEGNVVGWFQGRMEYGPRALGNRSILGDPRIVGMQKKMNLKIKNRESFRPFAPAILDGFQQKYFKLNQESQYMLITRKLDDQFLLKLNKENNNSGLNKVNQIRSTLPAITHIDNSCRIQTVKKQRNPKFFNLINEFYELTGCPVLINTSFNVRGEPIVCTPEDAFRCFVFTNIDYLVLGSFLIDKSDISNEIKNKFNKPLLIDD